MIAKEIMLWSLIKFTLFCKEICREKSGLSANEKKEKFASNDNNNYAAILTDSHHNVMDNADKSWQFTNKNYPANRK